MNKNWFYRVLALALVAMLAVPMFALADDDVLAPAAEAPAEELATAIEGEEEELLPIAKRSLNGVYILDVYLGYSVIEKLDSFDINVPADQFFQINLENSDGGKETFKSSNKKVAMVSNTGFVTLTGAGETIITCTGKVGGKKKTTKFKIEVKDHTNPVEINGHFYNTDDDWLFAKDLVEFSDAGSEELLENGKKYAKDYYIGYGFMPDDEPSVVYEPVPFNDDGDWIGPKSDIPYMAGYLYKHSNAKVMFFDGNNHAAAATILDIAEEGSPVDKPFVASHKFWTGPAAATAADNAYTYDYAALMLPKFEEHILVPVFYKNGTNKLTIKTMATAGLKSYTYTNTFEIPKEKVTLRRGTDKELMKRAEHSEEVLYQVDTLDIQSMDKVVLTLKIYNGTDWGIPVKDVKFAASVIDSNIALATDGDYTPFLQYGYDEYANGDTLRNVKVKGTVKAHKQTTITITFENHRNSDFNIKSLSGKVAGVFAADEDVYVDYLDEGKVKNFEESKKDALEILSPYPDVWDGGFGFFIEDFALKLNQDHWIMPEYAFGTAPITVY